MTTAAQLKPATDIVALVDANPVMVLTDKQKFSDFYTAMKAECDAHEPDLTTEKGRKAIASLAYKVARTKTAIDDAGKGLNEEFRSRINAVDESRREIRAQLDALKDEVRKPLTEWEEAEAARTAKVEQELAFLRDAATVGFDEEVGTVRERILAISAMAFDPDEFQGYHPQAVALAASTLATLNAAADRMDRETAERAELERLRTEAAEREARELAEREAAEAERIKAEAEAAEKARIEALEKQAEERARAEAEQKAQAEREAADRAHAEALAAERRKTEEAERAAQAERDRIAADEAARKQAEERAAAETKAREADREHRGKIMGAAKEAIMEAGPVPNISIKF